ncbi:sperm-associated antigen 8 [Gouania willdenowi]|uniref:sperm-associated antigen 8 n=1 Tax=Gouania willdenowi TaxID=441366 RepID=UPI0010557893|nr:sperm-associated antigen 8-like [Gouania willdenowi]
MDEQRAAVENTAGTRLLVKVEALEKTHSSADEEDKQRHIQRHEHKGIFTFDPESKMENLTTTREDFAAPKKLGVRTRGIRAELLEKQMAQISCEKMKADTYPTTPESVYRTTTQEDFSAQGFVPHAAETTTLHVPDYRSNEAITFWSESRQRVQGVTSNSSFRKSAGFSTPITERLDEVDD